MREHHARWRHPWGTALSFLALCFVSLTFPRASQVRPLNLEEMAERADRVFLGRCVQATAGMDSEIGQMVTYATFVASTPANAGEAYVISPLAAGEVPLLLLTDTEGWTKLEWNVAHRALLYNVYRGTMASVTGMGGVFTSAATKLECGINTDTDLNGMPDASDSSIPPEGVILYYLVTGGNLLGEGPLGPPGSVPPRINDSQCQ